MFCPKCRKEEMARETFNSVEIDRCPVCKGMYFDRGELEHMVSSVEIGTGDTFAFSATSDAMDAVPARCFRCGVDMTSHTCPAGLRIDKCERCEGVFLDQGELATLQLEGS